MKSAQQVLENDVCDCGKTIADAEQYYIDNTGQLETAAESQFARGILDLLATRFTSPVQSVETVDGETYYGVIEYTEGEEWYGFFAHDHNTQTRRVIGTREIAHANHSADLPHVTAGDETGSFADQPDATYEDLVTRLTDHYDEQYGTDREPPAHSGPPDHVDLELPPRATNVKDGDHNE